MNDVDGGWMMILVVELLYGEVRNMNEKSMMQ